MSSVEGGDAFPFEDLERSLAEGELPIDIFSRVRAEALVASGQLRGHLERLGVDPATNNFFHITELDGLADLSVAITPVPASAKPGRLGRLFMSAGRMMSPVSLEPDCLRIVTNYWSFDDVVVADYIVDLNAALLKSYPKVLQRNVLWAGLPAGSPPLIVADLRGRYRLIESAQHRPRLPRLPLTYTRCIKEHKRYMSELSILFGILQLMSSDTVQEAGEGEGLL